MARKKKADETVVEATPNVNPDDVAECYVSYTEHMGVIARERQKIATMLARYEGMGVHTKSVRACYRLANMEDAPDYVKEMLRTAAILKIIPAEEESDGQMTFLPGLRVAPPSPAKQASVNRSKMFWDGYDAGVAGHLIETCTFNPGSEDFVNWRDGWQQGHNDWQAKPKNQNVENASAERKPRGRPRKAADHVDDRTQLEKDESSYRGQEPETQGDVEPVTGALH